MSLQIFLQGKILGTDAFLISEKNTIGKIWWTSLLSEVLPRALLAELGLSSVLLGSSGGHQFLAVIPDVTRGRADEFCQSAATAIAERSGGTIRFIWAGTENLGSWPDIRRRLDEELAQKERTPLAVRGGVAARTSSEQPDVYFEQLEAELPEIENVGWSPEAPGDIQTGNAKHSWRIDEIGFARHRAPAGEPGQLAELAAGRKNWGVLLGDVDNFAGRLRASQNVEEHLQISLMYNQFFASELQMRCSLPEFWQRVTLLWANGEDFALYGSWDALVGIAREVQRIFSIFVDTNLKEFAGLEGKTLSMAIALSRSRDDDLATVLADGYQKLEIAKASGNDGIYLFGRTLEWGQLTEAAATRETMTRMVKQFGASPQFLNELASFYAEADAGANTLLGGRGRNDRVERPWRFHRRLNRVIGHHRDREFQRLRTELIADFTGRRAKQIRLRPQGRVALEWARLETEEQGSDALG